MLHHRKLIIVGANEKSLSLLDQEIMFNNRYCPILDNFLQIWPYELYELDRKI